MRSTILIFFTTMVLVGCSTTAELYPVKGPLSETSPTTILYAKVEGIMGNSGKLSMATETDEQCIGRWSSAAGVEVSVSTVNLFSQYGSLSGTGVSTRNKAGVNRGEAILVCPSGNRFEIEFYTGSGTANGYGIAKDSKDNIYKVLF